MGPGDRALAVIDLDDSLEGCRIPLGSAGVAAAYTDHCTTSHAEDSAANESWQNSIYLEGR
jgi:hypothetical protein